ncbi:hypothetical protein B1R32_10829 [Abditibacterium utsteinense]|uniref:Nucleotidyl transferase AbiEii toxin, Type IV TA system n=1 Tax=Abditibacterium utsteinense TaxID=1960156 RepID=A0A2S8SSQ8_9BACT|nr:hypothetical protein [Abditibacterium utsteinense]PQV63825.1 hypothetical protein B1R32_10829 [Abditibacterium utsteinense]
MEKETIERIIRRFNEEGIRYLIAGGFAVIAHGYTRLTMDLDIVLDLEPDNALKALEVLKSEGYAPKIAVSIEQFADADLRRDWVENRNMVAFPLWSEQHRRTGIDLFITEPLDFERAYSERLITKIAPELEADFVSLADLLFLKRAASRPKDLQDIYYLQNIQEKSP